MPRINVDMKLTDTQLWTQLGPALEFSPDGSRMAYVTGTESSRQLYVRVLDQLVSTRLGEGANGESAPYHPFFSPDGQWIGYVTSTELRKVPVSGGTPLTLCKVNRSRGATWSPDNTIVFATSPNSGLSVVPAAGGEPKALTTLDEAKKEATHRWPQVLPGGKAGTLHVAHAGDWQF